MMATEMEASPDAEVEYRDGKWETAEEIISDCGPAGE